MRLLFLYSILSPAIWASNSYQGCIERIATAHTLKPERLVAVLSADPASTVCLKNVPERFKVHPDFHKLVYDPDRKLISPQTIREAMAAIQSVENLILVGPLQRAPQGSTADFFDGSGRPVDIKCYSSPRTAEGSPIDPPTLVEWMITKLRREVPNSITGEKQKMLIILDKTYLTEEDYARLKAVMDRKLTADQQARVLEIQLPEPIRRLRPE